MAALALPGRRMGGGGSCGATRFPSAAAAGRARVGLGRWAAGLRRGSPTPSAVASENSAQRQNRQLFWGDTAAGGAGSIAGA